MTALDSDHCTALHHALKYDTSEFTAIASSVGQHIDPNVLNKSSETILIEAAKTKDDKLMTIHDTFGARYDPNIQDATGNTCLMYAVLNHSPDVIAALLRHPVIDLTIKNGFHKTIIYCVYRQRKYECQLKNKDDGRICLREAGESCSGDSANSGISLGKDTRARDNGKVLYADSCTCQTRRQRMTKFLSILPYCGEQAYPSFIAALRATNKGYVADMLEAYDPSSAPASDASSDSSALVPVTSPASEGETDDKAEFDRLFLQCMHAYAKKYE